MRCDELDPRWYGTFYDQERWHFHRQLLERYGVVLAPGDYSDILRQIAAPDAYLVEHRRGRQAIYWVLVPSCRERVFILAKGEQIITAWPPERRLAERRRAIQAERKAANGEA